MTENTLGSDWTPESGPDREADLVRGLMAVVQLMVSSDDIAVVYDFVVSQCVSRMGVAGAALMLDGSSALVPTSVVGAAAPALAELQHAIGAGPSVDAATSGAEVDAGIDEARVRWPTWASVAAGHAVEHVTAVPVRLVEAPVGALELHLEAGQSLTATDSQVARTFAGLAAVVAHQDATLRRSSTQLKQLERALQSRVVIEQAKGFLLAHGCASARDAFEVMRSHARRSGRRVDLVAEDVLRGRLDPLRLCG